MNEFEIFTVFQPVVSVRTPRIIGVEALSRGRRKDGTIISADRLFSSAREERDILELDRKCREQAMANFGRLAARHPDLVLFVNFDAELIGNNWTPGYFLSQIRKSGIPNERVVVEILESRVQNTENLTSFVNYYREAGLMVALDDVGVGHSNLNRISVLKPDIIKIDRSLIKEIHDEFYNQQIFQAIVNMGKRIGSLVIAEGVETLDEALKSLELGADFLQGFFVSRPVENACFFRESIEKRIAAVASELRSFNTRRWHEKREQDLKFSEIAKHYADLFAYLAPDDFDDGIRECLDEKEGIECMYILDSRGVQVTRTIFFSESEFRNPFMFSPARRGSDHSLKEYVQELDSRSGCYISGSYISWATGNLCRTVSTRFSGHNGKTGILCIDILERRFSESF